MIGILWIWPNSRYRFSVQIEKTVIVLIQSIRNIGLLNSTIHPEISKKSEYCRNFKMYRKTRQDFFKYCLKDFVCNLSRIRYCPNIWLQFWFNFFDTMWLAQKQGNHEATGVGGRGVDNLSQGRREGLLITFQTLISSLTSVVSRYKLLHG